MLAERISPAEEGTGVATKKHHQKLAKQNKYEALIGSLDVLKILPGIFFFFFKSYNTQKNKNVLSPIS